MMPTLAEKWFQQEKIVKNRGLPEVLESGLKLRLNDADNIFFKKQVRPITSEELFAMGDTGRTELVKGELICMSPTGFEHGIVESRFDIVLRDFVRRNKLGEVLVGEVGIYISRNPDTVRGADAIYISNERLAQVKSKATLMLPRN